MHIPYKSQLEQLGRRTIVVSIDRDGADMVTGTVLKATDDGCYIEREQPTSAITFIEYRDVRGVSAGPSEWKDLT